MTCVLELEMEHVVETCHTHAQPKGANCRCLIPQAGLKLCLLTCSGPCLLSIRAGHRQSPQARPSASCPAREKLGSENSV
jgi:hypothetical protein